MRVVALAEHAAEEEGGREGERDAPAHEVVPPLQPLVRRAPRDHLLVERERDRDRPEDRRVLKDDHRERLCEAPGLWPVVRDGVGAAAQSKPPLDERQYVRDRRAQVGDREEDDEPHEEEPPRGAVAAPVRDDEGGAEEGGDGRDERDVDDREVGRQRRHGGSERDVEEGGAMGG